VLQVFFIHPPQEVEHGDVIKGSIVLTRQKVNHRLLWLEVKFTVMRITLHNTELQPVAPERTLKYKID